MTVNVVDVAPTKRTQQQRSETTTAALLAATVDAVLESGPTTSLAEIARRAGVTKGALQHHFPNKNELLIAVVSHGWSDLAERLQLLLDAPMPPVRPGERVRMLIEAMWASYQQPMSRAAFMISSDPNLSIGLAARLSPLFQADRQRLDALWSESFGDLDMVADVLVRSRRFVRSHLLGMLVQRQLPSVEPDPAAELSALCAATVHLLGLEASP